MLESSICIVWFEPALIFLFKISAYVYVINLYLQLLVITHSRVENVIAA